MLWASFVISISAFVGSVNSLGSETQVTLGNLECGLSYWQDPSAPHNLATYVERFKEASPGSPIHKDFNNDGGSPTGICDLHTATWPQTSGTFSHWALNENKNAYAKTNEPQCMWAPGNHVCVAWTPLHGDIDYEQSILVPNEDDNNWSPEPWRFLFGNCVPNNPGHKKICHRIQGHHDYDCLCPEDSYCDPVKEDDTVSFEECKSTTGTTTIDVDDGVGCASHLMCTHVAARGANKMPCNLQNTPRIRGVCELCSAGCKCEDSFTMTCPVLPPNCVQQSGFICTRCGFGYDLVNATCIASNNLQDLIEQHEKNHEITNVGTWLLGSAMLGPTLLVLAAYATSSVYKINKH